MNTSLTKSDLIAFEEEVKRRFLAKEIHAPIHLSSGNEDQLLDIFTRVNSEDWVLSTWRSHYHALLKGIPAQEIMAQIMEGHSMYINSKEHRFLSSSIVGGILPIALGLALGIKRNGGSEKVWAFIGDMTATTGIYDEFCRYAKGHALPVRVVIEDNGLSTNTPTREVWGTEDGPIEIERYHYCRGVPHVGVGQWVRFG